jgi:hypothetical protein
LRFSREAFGKRRSLFGTDSTKVPFGKAKLDPDPRDLLASAMFVKPLPLVKRVIFIPTPHRGSYMASNYFIKSGNKFINLAGGLAKSAAQIAKIREPSVSGTPLVIRTALEHGCLRCDRFGC